MSTFKSHSNRLAVVGHTTLILLFISSAVLDRLGAIFIILCWNNRQNRKNRAYADLGHIISPKLNYWLSSVTDNSTRLFVCHASFCALGPQPILCHVFVMSMSSRPLCNYLKLHVQIFQWCLSTIQIKFSFEELANNRSINCANCLFRSYCSHAVFANSSPQ